VAAPAAPAPAAPAPTAEERTALARAMALAESARGRASPNPPVGCVLLRDGAVVGDGVTAAVGGPHAEVAALRAAGAAARGATAVVTLEPCNHHGRTPPCTAALLAAGIRRVVFALPDPNPLATGGADALRGAGVEVPAPPAPDDVLRGAVAQQLEGFLTLVGRHRPHVTLKLAQTRDGRLVPADGQRWITGAAARRAVHRWRAGVDAVLVGTGTVLADDPRLDVRDVPSRHQPRPVVLDARLRTPPSARLVRPGAIVVTVAGHPRAVIAPLTSAGAEVLEVAPGGDGGVELTAALAALGREGIASVLAEPGATLAGALLAGDHVDRVVLHVAGGQGAGPPARAVDLPPARRWRTERSGGAGTDLILHLVPTVPAAVAHAHHAEEAA
jgi:diaminohydroxyphosphoribosylaminopyrimidine deaminase / 5-amino-6-(5-phosphoribosylamino)uracil reductase